MMSENGGVPKNNKNINNQTYPPPWIGAEEGDREDCGKTHVRGNIFFTRGPWAENIQYLMRNFLMVVGMHWWLSRCGRIFSGWRLLFGFSREEKRRFLDTRGKGRRRVAADVGSAIGELLICTLVLS